LAHAEASTGASSAPSNLETSGAICNEPGLAGRRQRVGGGDGTGVVAASRPSVVTVDAPERDGEWAMAA